MEYKSREKGGGRAKGRKGERAKGRKGGSSRRLISAENRLLTDQYTRCTVLITCYVMTCEDSIGSAGVYGGLPIERFGRYLFMCEIPFGHIDQSLRRSWLPIENAGATSTPVPEHSSPLATTTATIKEPAQSMKQPIDVQRSSGVSMQQPIGPLDFVEADVRDDNDVVKRLRLRAYDLNKLQAILINKVLDELFIEIVEFPLWSEDQLLALASNCQELCVLQSSPPKRKMNLKEITNRLKRKLCISR